MIAAASCKKHRSVERRCANMSSLQTGHLCNTLWAFPKKLQVVAKPIVYVPVAIARPAFLSRLRFFAEAIALGAHTPPVCDNHGATEISKI
jgi:hypothetical protein